MSDNVTSTSTSMSAPTASLPTVEEINGWNQDRVKRFLEEKTDELELEKKDVDTIYTQRVTGKAFLRLNEDRLTRDNGPFRLKYGPASAITELIEQIKGGNVPVINSLKREFANVIKEELVNVKEEVGNVKVEVGGLRHEIKRVRLQSEIMWFSAPATNTETAKGLYVKDHVLGKFRNPPNANNPTVPEKKLQEYFMRECTALGLLSDTKLIVHDTHSTPLLDTRKPDFVLTPKGWPLDSLNVVVVGEIRTQSSSGFSLADVGHAISFGEKVLQIQPRRAYVYVLLTDCIDIRIYKVTRANNANNDNSRFSYEIVSSLQTLTFDTKNKPPTGWRYLVTIMQCTLNSLGWVDPSLYLGSDTVNLVRSINIGRTSIVYEGKVNDSNRVVVKLAKEEIYLSCFATEKNVLNELSAMNSPHLQKLLLEDEGVLVTTPLGSKVNHLQKKDIRNIIKTLETVHSTYNRVHMDLRRYNFLRDDDGQIVIIDWGYSVAKDETGNLREHLKLCLTIS